MHKRIMLALALMLAAWTSPSCWSGPLEYVPAEGWLASSESSRFDWTFGVTQGQALILEEINGDTSRIADSLLPADQVETLSQLITQYYQDASNAYIPWRYMAVIAAWRLAGKPEAVINKRLESLREYAQWARQQRKK